MQEFFFTLLSMWVIYKLFDAFGSGRRSAPSSQQSEPQREGDVKINSSKNTSSKFSEKEGEYVDYEEIKD